MPTGVCSPSRSASASPSSSSRSCCCAGRRGLGDLAIAAKRLSLDQTPTRRSVLGPRSTAEPRAPATRRAARSDASSPSAMQGSASCLAPICAPRSRACAYVRNCWRMKEPCRSHRHRPLRDGRDDRSTLEDLRGGISSEASALSISPASVRTHRRRKDQRRQRHPAQRTRRCRCCARYFALSVPLDMIGNAVNALIDTWSIAKKTSNSLVGVVVDDNGPVSRC